MLNLNYTPGLRWARRVGGAAVRRMRVAGLRQLAYVILGLGIMLGHQTARGAYTMSQVLPASEYNALLDFYSKMGGANWVNQTGWTNPGADISQMSLASAWYGVQVGGPVVVSNGVVLHPGNVLSIAMASNNLTGQIPISLTNLTQLQVLQLVVNPLSGAIPDGLGQLSNISRFILANDHLTGSIPPDLGNIGDQMIEFNVGYNALTGEIPASLGNFYICSIFVVASNQLSGTIPITLSNLPSRYIDFSTNNLYGEIPTFRVNGNPPDTSIHLEGNCLDTRPNSPSLVNIGAMKNLGFTNIFYDAVGSNGACPYLPLITTGPTNQTVPAGTNVAFHVQANGTGTLFYQWQSNGVNLLDAGRIAGALGSTLNISNAQISDSGHYQVLVSNAYGVAASAFAALTVKPLQVQLAGLEVTQVSQDLSNTVPLVQGKTTIVRAYLQLPSTNSAPIKSIQGLRLHGYLTDTIEFSDSPISPSNPPVEELDVTLTNALILRPSMSSVPYFRLPADWTVGTTKLRFDWTNTGGAVTPINAVAADNSVTVTFTPVPKLQVKLLVVTNVFSGAPAVPEAAAPDPHEVAERLRAIYPVPDVDWTTSILPIYVTNTFINTEKDMLPRLSAMRASDAAIGQAAGSRLYHALLPIGYLASNGKLSGIASGIPGTYSTAFYEPGYGIKRETSAHEIGHSLGRPHDTSGALFGTLTLTNAQGPPTVLTRGACNEYAEAGTTYPLFQPLDTPSSGLAPALGPLTNGDLAMVWGMDTYSLNNGAGQDPLIDPRRFFDLMGYCKNIPDDRWLSSYTCKKLINGISQTFGNPPVQPFLTGNYLIVRGVIDFDAGTASFLPFQTWNGISTPPSAPAGTNFVLEALDGSANVLQQVSFSVTPYPVEEDGERFGDFMVALGVNSATRTVVLTGAGIAPTLMTASVQAPVVTVTSPGGGQVYSNGPMNVGWSGSDADGDPLTYSVQYSADGGTTWTMLTIDWTGTSFQAQSSQLAATTRGLMRVTASDGFNSTSAESSGFFTVLPHPPAIYIRTPADGTVFALDQEVFMETSVVDMQDGSLEGTNVQWRSSRDGALGTGDEVHFATTALREGYHTITVTATDSKGLSSSAVTHIFALRQAQPQLTILVAGPQAMLSWASSYTNYALQASSSLTSGWSNITNAPAINGNQQTVTVSLAGAAKFYRLLGDFP